MEKGEWEGRERKIRKKKMKEKITVEMNEREKYSEKRDEKEKKPIKIIII